MYQASLIPLIRACSTQVQHGEPHGDGRQPEGSGCPERASTSGTSHRGSYQLGLDPPAGEVQGRLEGAGRSRLGEEPRRLLECSEMAEAELEGHWAKRGGLGKAEDPGGGEGAGRLGQADAGSAADDDANDAPARSRTLPPSRGHLLRDVQRCGGPRMPASPASHGGELVGTVCAEEGHLLPEGDHDVVLAQAAARGAGEDPDGRHPDGEVSSPLLDGGRGQRPLTVLDLLGVEQRREKGAGVQAAAPQAPGSAHHPRQDGLGHSSAGSADQLSQHQGHGHRQGQRGDPVHDQHRPAPSLDRGRAPGPAKTVWMLLHEANRKPSPPGSGTTPTAGEADGGGIHGDGFLRLGTAADAVGGPGRPPANAVSRSIRLNGSEEPRLPVAQLRNPDNICYANAALQVFYWLGVLTGQPAACYGRVQAGTPVLTATGSQYLPACMHLQVIFRGWPALHRQQDVVEFMQHILDVTQPHIFEGSWEARLTNPHTVSETGYLQCLLMLHFPGTSLQSMINAWHEQYSAHALVVHSGVIMLQLCRYAGTSKVRQSLHIAAGESIQLPVFSEPQQTAVRWESFKVVWVLFHKGARVTEGHYQSALCCPSHTGWRYKICNDARTPYDPTSRDIQSIDRDAYLVGLLSAGSLHE